MDSGVQGFFERFRCGRMEMGLLGSGGPVAEVFSERYADDEASGRGFQAYKYFEYQVNII